MFGGPTDEPTATRIVAQARAAGVNFIDTADIYADGRSEEIIGRAIARAATSGCSPPRSATGPARGRTAAGCRANGCMQAAERSLRRLGTDYIDIYYLHKEDHDTPLAETVRAIGDLIRDGKVRYFGVSNHRSWRVAEICRICDDPASTGRWSASPTTTCSTARPRPSICRPAPITASASSPTARWRAAC